MGQLRTSIGKYIEILSEFKPIGHGEEAYERGLAYAKKVAAAFNDVKIAYALDTAPSWNGTLEDTECVPWSIRSGVSMYRDNRAMPGAFLRSVLENNLKQAVMMADPSNIQILPAIVSHVHATLPAVAWGSQQRVKDWVGGRYEEEVESTKGASE